ncbi:hypothetical protein EYS42_03230 [Aquabacterium lacunae]|uniref:Uncharacterized protein n=1 Tax=Aquabacterium lacunae TaxID=2528630 RepID=A0A4Q9H2J2_9BURK|nr:hypothetical protein [Aquabacterium lacunae]TBO34439.1 hypothetical protein EYS42_03230 [Aquabacterium lacunae]
MLPIIGDIRQIAAWEWFSHHSLDYSRAKTPPPDDIQSLPGSKKTISECRHESRLQPCSMLGSQVSFTRAPRTTSLAWTF